MKLPFEYDYTSRHIDLWTSLLQPFSQQRNVLGIEIGCLEGRSSIWFLENVLQDPSSRLICIDPEFAPEFEKNLGEMKSKVQCIPEKSEVVLRSPIFVPDSAHFVYIDGDHSARSVLQDAVLAFPLLRVGGIMIFDDYRWKSEFPESPETMPKIAIDAFLRIFCRNMRLRHMSWQVAVERTS